MSLGRQGTEVRKSSAYPPSASVVQNMGQITESQFPHLKKAALKSMTKDIKLPLPRLSALYVLI
jgi:hypothetical protein